MYYLIMMNPTAVPQFWDRVSQAYAWLKAHSEEWSGTIAIMCSAKAVAKVAHDEQGEVVITFL